MLMRAAVLAAFLALTAVFPALAETRVALVIANSAYQNTTQLPNPLNDGPGVAEALRRAGFRTVTVQPNLDYDAMRRVLRTFAEAAREADFAVVYYAGHGMELGGDNYLIPVDAKLVSDADVQYEAIPLSLVTQSVSGARRLGLVMLDACRNNPFDVRMRRSGGATRAVTRGLTRIEPIGNTLVVYAARDGTTAEDGSGRNSPFAAALIRILPSPGLEVDLMFRKVRDDVMRSTDNKQQPFVYGSLGGEPIYLIAPNSNITINVTNNTPLPAAPPPSPLVADVRRAVELAQTADKRAQDKASEARLVQTAAMRAATAARSASQRGERGEPGFGVLSGDGMSAAGVAVKSRYTGEIVNGQAQGLGVRVWSDGFRQEGEWVANLFTGNGVTTDPRGNFVVGRWAGEAMVLVVESLPNGERFEGEYSAGRRSLGVFIGGANRDYAERSGEWSASGLNGYGVVRWRNGARSEGEFSGDQPNGAGAFTNAQGRVVEQGIYRGGRLAQPLTP
ncbi:MAG TPA: caspase family protein [Phenylobacterium sp.]